MGNPARKYVDLISKVSGKYANWDPPKVIEIGDWGYMDRKTATFVKEGNIFEDAQCSEVLEDTGKLIRYGSPEDNVRYTARAKASLGNDVGLSLGVSGEIGFKIKGSWDIDSKNRAAILTATDAYSIYLQYGAIFPKLARITKLAGKAIVVETLNCPAYALLLTDKGKGGKVSITLETRLAEAGANMGSVVGGRWESTSESGVWRTASGYRASLGEQNAVFTPLFVLKTTATRKWPMYRGSPSSLPRGVPAPDYQDYDLPWEGLDEDGEECDSDDDLMHMPTSPEF